MRFFSEQDYLNYREYLLKTIQETIIKLSKEDSSIKVVLLGEFPDNNFKFVTVHPFSDKTHIHRKEYDHYASLVQDILPQMANMVVFEVGNEPIFTRPTEGN